METFKQFIRPFCKLEKSITYLKFGCSYRCGNAFRKTMMTRHILIPVCTHIFHSGTPIRAKQGVPDACIKNPSENPEDRIERNSFAGTGGWIIGGPKGMLAPPSQIIGGGLAPPLPMPMTVHQW